MTDVKTWGLTRLIPAHIFDVCEIDGLTKSEIIAKYSGRANGAYYLSKFQKHLESQGTSFQKYCKDFFGFEWPKCPGTGKNVGFKIGGTGLVLKEFAKGGVNARVCPNFKSACDKMRADRRGESNPMFGKKPWNFEKKYELPRGRRLTEEHKQKLKERRAASPLKARHTTKHSAATIERLRKSTANLWASGRFNRKTSIEIRMAQFLSGSRWASEYVEQYQFAFFVFDFALPERKIAIECQGTYFHVDPRIYKGRVLTEMQKRNLVRDARKKAYASKAGWRVIEVWETEINDGSFEEFLTCELSK